MDPKLKAAIQEFAATHPEYSTKDGSNDKCREASGRFCEYLRTVGITAMVDELAVVNGVAHKAVRVGPLWIDWTSRQFNANAPWPEILLG